MSKTQLITLLNSITVATKANRLRVAHAVMQQKELFPLLVKMTFETNNKVSIKAAWTLELICLENIDWIAPYLNYFTTHLSALKYDSAIRPAAKICMLLAMAFHDKKNVSIIKDFGEQQQEKMIETGFDWLIGNQKVAAKVYSMEMLYLLGKNTNWVHRELQLIIQQNISKESCAYEARGKKILSRIKNKPVF